MNKYFVFEHDGTLRAAQETEKGALCYMNNERILHIGTPETALKFQKKLRRQAKKVEV
jgi:hypothetical protein